VFEGVRELSGLSGLNEIDLEQIERYLEIPGILAGAALSKFVYHPPPWTNRDPLG
jgi:hypothetical protein